MKKIIGVLAFAILTLTLISCSGEKTKQDSQPKKELAEVVNTNWKKLQVVDEFNDPVEGEFNTVGTFEGVENVSGKNIPLKIQVQLVGNQTYIKFINSMGMVEQLTDKKFIDVSVKNEAGAVSKIQQFTFDNYLVDSDSILYNMLMESNQELKINVNKKSLNKFMNGNYVFTMSSKGL